MYVGRVIAVSDRRGNRKRTQVPNTRKRKQHVQPPNAHIVVGAEPDLLAGPKEQQLRRITIPLHNEARQRIPAPETAANDSQGSLQRKFDKQVVFLTLILRSIYYAGPLKNKLSHNTLSRLGGGARCLAEKGCSTTTRLSLQLATQPNLATLSCRIWDNFLL